jgi:hypothetical protein
MGTFLFVRLSLSGQVANASNVPLRSGLVIEVFRRAAMGFQRPPRLSGN